MRREGYAKEGCSVSWKIKDLLMPSQITKQSMEAAIEMNNRRWRWTVTVWNDGDGRRWSRLIEMDVNGCKGI
ncbi:hypothetical protein Ddye_028723 [Dipteronia dyeriana]|uniref:Uncharacterized protein n=1 Tax=Dipteronia dyeriana TaxID=168575 RepID=A0AAD9WJY1_9ROSI|nr:hypothetical protein Ddye_028723 [Dipteronia dyeriana]